MPRTYNWHELKRRGDWIFSPGARANQVARLAKKYVAKHMPEGSEVVTVTAPDGAITFLTYLPPPPKPKSVEPRTEDLKPTRTHMDAARMAANPSMNNPENKTIDQRRQEATERLERQRAEEEAAERAARSSGDEDGDEGWASVDAGDDDE